MDTAPQRIYGLDLVRATAISMVVVSHSIEILLPLRQVPVIGYLAGKIIALTFPLGIWGVELFFALSGMLIGTILIREYITEDTGREKSLFHFWKMRWMRTLPSYYIVLAIVALLNHYVFYKETGIGFVFFIQNFASLHPAVFGEAWSLSIEEWSYLILPFLFVALKNNKSKKKFILPGLLIYILASVLARYLNAFDPLLPHLDNGIRKVVLFRMDAVAWGIVMACLQAFYREKIKKIRVSLFMTGIIGIVTLGTLNYLGTHPSFHFYISYPWYQFLIDAFLFTLYPVFFAILLPYALYIKAPKKNYIQKAVTKISILSYSIYLTHGYILLHLMKTLIQANTPTEAILFFIVYFTGCIVFAMLLHRLVEVPFLKRREKMRGTK